MRVLVTGGAGFIGSALCLRLVGTEGYSILNVDKLSYAANPRSLAALEGDPRYAFAQIDICDGAALDAAFGRFQPGAVLHLAAETHVDRSITDPSAFIDTNVVGTYRLLEAARRYCARLGAEDQARFRFVHVSTDEVFGSLGPAGRFTEETAYRPSSPYSASKAGSDHLAHAWHRTFGLPLIVCNCSNNYGPRQFPEKLIPLTILNAAEDKPLPVYGNGSQIRDWLHVEDFVDGLVKALARGAPGQSYNFGGAAERSNLAVVELICDALDRAAWSGRARRALISFVADRPGHDQRYAMDTSKARRDLGWQPAQSFEAGIARTVRWYLDNRGWWEPLRAHVYRGERLGLAETIG